MIYTTMRSLVKSHFPNSTTVHGVLDWVGKHKKPLTATLGIASGYHYMRTYHPDAPGGQTTVVALGMTNPISKAPLVGYEMMTRMAKFGQQQYVKRLSHLASPLAVLGESPETSIQKLSRYKMDFDAKKGW